MPKLCEFETCRKQASYGCSYGKPIRCKEHKEEYKLVSKLCQEDNCNKFSSFNFKNETKPMYCMEHKKVEMVNFKI
jgi:nitrite reductase/ring-hydroxylating ferredoxin subunit